MNEQIWFKNYDNGVPHTLAPYPERTLLDVLAESASLRPNSWALLFQGKTISYALRLQHDPAPPPLRKTRGIIDET